MRQYKHFDTLAEPITTRWYLKPIMWLLSVPVTKLHRTKITKTGMEGVKAPYLLLCNHNSFYDFQVLTAAIFPQNANYVVAIDAFVGPSIVKWLMLHVGCFGKRKFTSNLPLVRQMKRIVEKGNIACMYPEARYSLCGTTAVLPKSLGKLCKLLDVPVVVFMCNGHHVNAPCWNQTDRGVKGTDAELKLVLTTEQVREMSVDEINARLVEEFQYDDFAWQKRNGIRSSFKKRAEGLHRILYQCPHCGTEFEMSSKGDTLKCNHCGQEWKMTEYGELHAVPGTSSVEGGVDFTHIPDWYEWERANVRKEVVERRYGTGPLEVTIRTIPDNKAILLGTGTLEHDFDGFHIKGTTVDGEPFSEEHPVESKYSCHLEFDYKQYGECLDLSTLEDTWFFSSKDKRFCLTKFALATEELYFEHRRLEGKPCEPGLA